MSQDVPGIYVLKNKINGKIYVGQTSSLKSRKAEHFYALRTGKCFNRHLQRSWDKNGEAAFEFKALFSCSIDLLTYYEQRICDLFRSRGIVLYNQKGQVDSPSRGTKLSPERRAQISKSLRERKRNPVSDETKRKIALALRGQSQSDFSKLKKSLSMKITLEKKRGQKNGTTMSIERLVELARAAKLNESTIYAIKKTGEFYGSDKKASAAWRAAIAEGQRLYGMAQAEPLTQTAAVPTEQLAMDL